MSLVAPHLRTFAPLGALLGLVGLLTTTACPNNEYESLADLAVDPAPARPVEVGLFADCTPSGFSDVVCQSGLRCGMVQVGDPPSQGSVAQCVPVVQNGLGADEPCQFDQGGAPPTGGGPNRYYDRCAEGLGCVETEAKGWRCQKLCPLKKRGPCGEQLCVLPSQVSGTGYCAAGDHCQAVFPQSGCGLDLSGRPLNCYVLTDDKGGDTFCMRPQPYGTSTGALDSACERSVHCQIGLACTMPTGHDGLCRPYCTLPVVPDGGSPPDPVRCENDLGVCHPIARYEQVGRCY